MAGGRYEATAGPDACAAMLAVIFMLNGMPMLYNGQEVADDAPHSIFANREHGRLSVNWARAVTPLGRSRLELVRRLTALRHAHPGLFDAPVVWQETSEPSATLAFTRPLPEGWLTLAVNVTGRAGAVSLPEAQSGGRLVLSSAGVELAGGVVSLPAHGFAIVGRI